MTDNPNPGSPEAIEKGCACPILDNAHGRGYMGGVKDQNGGVIFVMRADCPLHGHSEINQGEKT